MVKLSWGQFVAGNYGLPYKGSKNKIAEWVVNNFLDKKHFYDLFAGGCAITHRAMLSGKFETFTINDVLDIPQLFVDAINGKFKSERRWISRNDFYRLKDTEPYVKVCWSFGNNGRDYLYSREIEPYKKACHYAIVFDQWEELATLCPEITEVCKQALNEITDIQKRRLAFGPAVVKELKRLNDWNLVQNNLLYKSCYWQKGGLKERQVDLQSLERLESLQSLERLTIYKGSYADVPIKENSLIYCDIPYRKTNAYDNEFDYEEFYKWAENQKELVFISEYEMPKDRFICIAEIEKQCTLSATNNSLKKMEKLFIPKTQEKLYLRQKIYKQLEFEFKEKL